MLTPTDPTAFAGPCGEIEPSPPTQYRPGELIIRLQDHAVTDAGFSDDTHRLLLTLGAYGAKRIESLRGTWDLEKSMSTGKAPWNVRFGQGGGYQAAKLELDEATQERWMTFPDSEASWVGVTAQHGNVGPGSAPLGEYTYTLDFSHFISGRGFFSFFWAADNDVRWSIDPAGTIDGDLSATNAFQKDLPLRVISGTFQPGTRLTAHVVNTAIEGADPGAPNPSGLLVFGRAGTYPEPILPDETEGTTPSVLRGMTRLLVETPAGAKQAAVRLCKGTPGSVPTPGEMLNAPLLPSIQEELRRLLVYFDGEPSPGLIRCLRLASPVRYAERIPLSQISGDSSQTNSVTVWPQDYKAAIARQKAPDLRASNLAIFDDLFSASSQHGRQVWSVACQCLFDGLPATGNPTPVYCFGITLGGYIHPTEYFTALRDVRIVKDGFPQFRVINLSRGASDWYKAEMEEIGALEKQEIIMVAAAGQNAPGWMVDYPAAYPTVVSVGGVVEGSTSREPWTNMNCNYDVEKLRCLDKKVSGSAIDVAAPSANLQILSLTSKLSGTSFAAPMVAALCATICDSVPTASASKVREAIFLSAETIDPVRRKVSDNEPNVSCGAGMIQWDSAIQLVQPAVEAE